MKRPWTFVRMLEFFPPVNSVNWWQEYLSEIVFRVLVGFLLLGKWRNYLVSRSYPYTQDMLDSTNNDPNFMNTIITGNESWVYRYNPETKLFRHFPYNENSWRALNTTSLKCCLPSTDVMYRRQKIHVCVWRFKVASYKRASLKSTRFLQKQIRSNTFLNF